MAAGAASFVADAEQGTMAATTTQHPDAHSVDESGDSGKPLALAKTRRPKHVDESGDSGKPLALRRLKKKRSRPPLTPRPSALPPPVPYRQVILVDPVHTDQESSGSSGDFMPSRPRAQSKGKAKAQQSEVEMTTDGEAPKVYQQCQPKATGKIHDPPCSFCQGRRLVCFEDENGSVELIIV